MKKTLVIIPSYNNLKLIEKCLYCLKKQDIDDFDTLVVDNGSTNDVVEFLSSWSKESDRNHVVLFDSNLGFAKACNRGFKYSVENNYEYSILLNNDAFVEKDFVKALEQAISGNKKYFAVNSLMISYKDTDLIDDLGDNYCILGWAYQNKVGLKVQDYAYDINCFSACGGASIYRNSILKKIGFLDDNFFAYLEDVDLSYRAKLYGYRIKTCINARCYHLGSATSGSKYNKFKVRLSSRNNVYLIYKNMPLVQIIINLFPILCGMFVKLIFFLSRGFFIDYILGIFDAIKDIKNIERIDFKFINPVHIIFIEIELIINTFIYIKDFLNRKVFSK